jgi:hypothetical protein
MKEKITPGNYLEKYNKTMMMCCMSICPLTGMGGPLM